MWRALCLTLFLAMTASATAGTLDLPNEIVNGDFEATSWDPWTNESCGLLAQGQNGLPVNPDGGQTWAGMILYWSGNYQDPMGKIRQTVDESQFPGWDPTANRKIIDLEFDYLLGADIGDPVNQAGLKVYLCWLGDGTQPPNPADQRQLAFEQWQSPSSQVPEWSHADISLELPIQPRLLCVEFEVHARFAETTVVGIDNVSLEGQCVPEPSALALFALAAIATIRRRR